MEWIDLYKPDNQPSEQDIAEFINNPLWAKINTFMQDSYHIQPSTHYSGCSGQPGWNIKYQKAGKSLCTLYPMDGFFIVLVVIGTKEYEDTLALMPSCTEYVRELFESVPHSSMGRWLMIHVENEAVLDDVKNLIQIRRKIK